MAETPSTADIDLSIRCRSWSTVCRIVLSCFGILLLVTSILGHQDRKRIVNPFYPRSVFSEATSCHYNDSTANRPWCHRAIRIWLPEVLGCLLWTGFYNVALEETDKWIDESTTDQISVNAMAMDTLFLLKSMILYKMGRTNDAMLLYRDTLLPLIMANSNHDNGIPVAVSLWEIGKLHARPGIADYEQAIYWFQKSKDAVASLEGPFNDGFAAKIDQDIRRTQSYKDWVDKNSGYRDLLLALAQDIKFTDNSIHQTIHHNTFVQYRRLVMMIGIVLTTNRFRKKLSVDSSIQLIFVFAGGIYVCFLLLLLNITPIRQSAFITAYLSLITPAKWWMMSLESGRLYLLKHPNEYRNLISATGTQFFLLAASLCIRTGQYKNSNHIIRAIPDLIASDIAMTHPRALAMTRQLAGLGWDLEQATNKDSLLEPLLFSRKRPRPFLFNKLLVMVPQTLGWYIWTGFYHHALKQTEIFENEAVGDPILKTLFDHRMTEMRAKILSLMGRSKDAIILYRDTLLPAYQAGTTAKHPGFNILATKCMVSIGGLYERVGMAEYQKALHWMKKAKESVPTETQLSFSWGIMALGIDRQIETLENYQTIVTNRTTYRDLLINLAQNVQFAELPNEKISTEHMPSFQYCHLVMMIHIGIVANHFRRRPHFRRVLECFALFVLCPVIKCLMSTWSATPTIQAYFSIGLLANVVPYVPKHWIMETLEIGRKFFLAYPNEVRHLDSFVMIEFFRIAAFQNIRASKYNESRWILQAVTKILESCEEIDSPSGVKEQMDFSSILEKYLESLQPQQYILGSSHITVPQLLSLSIKVGKNSSSSSIMI